MMDKADNRNPDAFDMYIYNDFFNYAILDLIDGALGKLHARIVKKDWEEAYIMVLALTCFMENESSWPGEWGRLTHASGLTDAILTRFCQPAMMEKESR